MNNYRFEMLVYLAREETKLNLNHNKEWNCMVQCTICGVCRKRDTRE